MEYTYVSYFDPKHRLRFFGRIESTHDQCFDIENIKILLLKKKSVLFRWASFRNVLLDLF